MTTVTAPGFTVESVKALHAQAHSAGMAALEAAVPTPMLWGSPTHPLGSNVDLTKPHSVDFEGPCGFASICFKGNTAFGRAMKKAGIAKSYSASPGLYIWVREGGQSLERKEAYAWAYASVMVEAGAKVWVESRMD